MQSGVTSENGTTSPKRGIDWRILLAVGAVMLLTIALRAWRLGGQSVWYDDYNSVAYLAAPDLSTYMTIVHHRNPEHMPLYYVLQYGWSRVAGTEPTNVRWLSVLLHALCVPMLWSLGRRLGGCWAGAVAALLFCCSPWNIYYGQSLRPYALIPLLSLAALFSLERARQGRWRWLGVNGIASALLLYTHLFSGLFVAVEGVCLLWVLGKRRGRALAWAAMVVLLALPLVPFGLHRAHMMESTYDSYVLPGAPQFVSNLLGDDALSWQVGEVMPDGSTWSWLGAGGPAMVRAAQPAADGALIVFGFGACLFAAGWIVREKRRKAGEPKPFLAVALTVALAPPLLLLFLSLALRPCFAQRYTIYSCMALYLLLGFLTAKIRPTALRAVFLVVLCAAYAVGLSTTLPAVTRTNWLGLIAQVMEQAGPDDRLLVFGQPSPIGVLACQVRSLPKFPPVRPAYSIHSMREQVDKTLAAATQGGTSVWVAFLGMYHSNTRPAAVECLERPGLKVETTSFLGMAPVFLCRVRNDATMAGTAAERRPDEPDKPDPCVIDASVHERTLANTGILSVNADEHAAAVESLRNTVDFEVPQDKLALALIGFLVTDEGNPALGKSFAEASIRLAPEFGWGEFSLGFALWRLGDTQGARRAFESGTSRDAFLALYGPMVTALCDTGLSDRTRAEAERLDRMGIETPLFIARQP